MNNRAAALVLVASMACASAALAEQLATQPDDRLTPGSVSTDSENTVCRSGYSAMVESAMPRGRRASVYRAYGIANGDHGYVIDHRVPRSLGGTNDIENLWPEPKSGPMNSHVKDRVESLIHRMVCQQHRLALKAAQHLFLGDWQAVWVAYGFPPPLYMQE